MPTGCINKTTEYAWIEYSGIFCSSHGTAVPCILKKTSGNPSRATGSRKILYYFIVLLTGSGSDPKICSLFAYLAIFELHFSIIPNSKETTFNQKSNSISSSCSADSACASIMAIKAGSCQGSISFFCSGSHF